MGTMRTSPELVRQSLWSDVDDEAEGMEGDGEEEEDGMEKDEVRPGRRRRGNPFIEEEWGYR